MRGRRWRIPLLIALFPACLAANPLQGTWKARIYEIQGVEYPMEGMMIFTEKYFASNIYYPPVVEEGRTPNLNSNAGPYRVEGGRVIFTQWIQFHLRPQDQDEPILFTTGLDEAAQFQVEGDRLIILFPSGNRYILDRLPE